MSCSRPATHRLARISVVGRPFPIRPFVLFLTLAATLLAAAPWAGAQSIVDIDIDTADAETLAAALPGIGAVKARRIVEYRERHGPFGSLDALQAVKGIGPMTVERIREHLSGRPVGRAPGDAGNGPAVEPVVGSSVWSGVGFGGRAGRPPGGEPRSTTELELATRRAVRDIVVGARRDAAAALAVDTR